jgi:hypothetical protein
MLLKNEKLKIAGLLLFLKNQFPFLIELSKWFGNISSKRIFISNM